MRVFKEKNNRLRKRQRCDIDAYFCSIHCISSCETFCYPLSILLNERTRENFKKNSIVTLPVHCPTISTTRVWATMKCLEISTKNIATAQSQPRKFDLKPLNETVILLKTIQEVE